MIKRITTLVFVFLTIVGNAVWAQETQPSGQGTENNPYLLGTEADLKWFQEHVSESEENAKACAKLTADITLNSSEEWEPIGYADDINMKYSYTGTFDGDEHTISGLSAPLFTAIGTYEMNWSSGGAIFTKGGEVKNLVVKGNITNSTSLYATGGICIYNVGKISNSTNGVSISSADNCGGICYANYGSITDCINTADLNTSDFFYVGGICAQNAGSIEKCYNSGTISITSNSGMAGGISATCITNEEDIPSTIKNCYNCGKIQGQYMIAGICTYAKQNALDYPNITIENCHNYGELTGNEESRIAGILSVSSQDPSFNPNDYITVTNCYYKDDVEAGFIVYSIQNEHKVYDALGNVEFKDNNAFANGEVLALLQNNNPGVWTQGEKYPVFVAEGETPTTVYTITFDYNYEGSEPDYQYALEGSNKTVEFPEAPTREGYTFLGWSETKDGEVLDISTPISIDGDKTYYAQWQKIETEEPEQPSDDDDEDQSDTGIHKPQRPIKYYNIYIDTSCPGLNVEVSKDVVQEGHQVSAYLTIQSECDTTGMRFEYKRSLFGYWKDLKELAVPSMQPYPKRNRRVLKTSKASKHTRRMVASTFTRRIAKR